MIPEFAVLGHPNEGKSSVVSTLTEDDRIEVSRIPGETTVSKRYTVKIDGEKIIRFVDTPGFQVPRQALAWFREFEGDEADLLECFIDTHGDDPFFADECELLGPLVRGAGIIYVVDGSRPVRDDDLAEMEILRLTGRPRMAIINAKTTQRDYTADWRHEFRKHFNAIRLFNSNTANFIERIKMLESLKAIDQEWEPALSRVIHAFQSDWEKRNHLVCAGMIQIFEKSLSLTVSETIGRDCDLESVEERLNERYQAKIRALEKEMFKKIRGLFKHTLFEVHLPDYSILRHDLFSKQTWELLGLNKEQLATAGAFIGGTMGAIIDTAAAGITFGVFTSIGGILGAGSALLSGKKLAKKKTKGFKLGGDKLTLGPSRNLQFFYILIDRALIYYSHIVNRPHGKRDMPEGPPRGRKGFSTGFTKRRQHICAAAFKQFSGRALIRDKKTMSRFEKMMESILHEISSGE